MCVSQSHATLVRSSQQQSLKISRGPGQKSLPLYLVSAVIILHFKLEPEQTPV